MSTDREPLSPFRRGSERLTLAEAAARAGVELEHVLRINRAGGFAEPDPDARMFDEDDVEAFRLFDAGRQFFGEELMLQFTRVIGRAMARVADAAISTFQSNIGERSRTAPVLAPDVEEANRTAIALLPSVVQAMDVMLRRHMELRVRNELVLGDDWHGVDALDRAVGFCDLVGYTALAERTATVDLAAVIARFEARATDVVIQQGGSVVKLIGDEVMFVAPDPASGARIAASLVAAFPAGNDLPPVRVGIAAGRVILREGDYHGPVVNLAARVVKLAEPGNVLAPASIAADLGVPTEDAGTHELKGFEAPVPVVTLMLR